MIRVVVVAPVLAVRAGLRALIAAADIEVVWEAADLAEIEGLPLEADILLLAEALERRELRRLLSRAPVERPLSVLLLTENPRDVQRLIDLPLRSWGVLLLDVSGEEIQIALRALHEGLWIGDPTLVGSAFQTLPASGNVQERLPESPAEPLTERETEVLQWLAQGLANKQIGATLGISEHTVKFHVSSIYAKLGATNRAEAVRLGVQNGWVAL